MDPRFLAKLRASRPPSVAPRHDFTSEWFDEQRAFYDDPAQLVAAIKGRRAGGTRGGCAHFVRFATRHPGARLLYLNSTLAEARQLAWYGLKNDGMAALCERHKLAVKPNETRLELRFENGSLIQLRGADDEAELRKRLGFSYHEVWWDEAQKIPTKLAQSIREVLMPALLDEGGRLRLVGTPVRQMSGLFYDVTRPDLEHRLPGWSVHHWNLLANPFFGATHEDRWHRGILALQRLYGGELVAPIESPIMQREAFGRWTREDAAFVYAVHKVPHRELFYAPHRVRADGFVDVPKALVDLPWPHAEAFFALGADLGYHPDPFAFVLWAWHPHDPALYEVCSWKKTHLTADEQNAALMAVRQHIALGMVVADAGGPAKPTVKGWSKEWVERFRLPIIEAEKQHKYTAQTTFNGDILARRIKLREGSPLYDEMSQLQWATIVDGSGRMVEDPTMANDCCDGGLYAHRHSYQYRSRPEEKPPEKGSRAAAVLEETELEEDLLADDDQGYYH